MQAADSSIEHQAEYASLDEFLASVEKRAYRMAWFACKNEDEALELVQDAMMTLVDKYANKRSSDWPPLFHRILQNKINDRHRRFIVRSKVMHFFGVDENSSQIVESTAAPESENPYVQLQERLGISAIEEAIGKLPIRQQQTFLLRAWQGLDTRETANAMGISTGSVKTHYSRAIVSLRSLLEDR